MKQYLDLVKHVLENGETKDDRTGTGTTSVFGYQNRYDLREGFPLLTTKKVYFRGILHELLWFLKGDTNIKYLVDNNVRIWNEWPYETYKASSEYQNESLDEFVEKIKNSDEFAKKWGELGPVYGVQWRHWPAGRKKTVDQLGWAIEKIKKYPMKKHYIISAWNAGCIYEMSGSHDASMVIAPCHTMFHINITGDKLSLLLYQRSADLFLGVPFNIASYALLTMLLAQVTGYKPGDFVHVFGDVHIYENHFQQCKEQLTRKPNSFPKIKLNPKIKKIDDFRYEDIVVEGYEPHPPIKGDITVVGGF